MDLYKKLDGKADRKVEVILVNYDINQKSMDKYLTKSKINFPGLKQSETKTNFINQIQKVENSLPAIVLADASGKVIDSATGADCNKIIAKIPSLMK